MTNARSFQDLTIAINAPRAPTPERRTPTPERRTTVNPRVSAGLTPEQYDRKRRAERRATWLARAATHEATMTATKPVRAFISFEDAKIAQLRAESCLDRSVRIEIQAPARPERGPTVAAYFSAKWQRDGTLGEHEALCQFYAAIRKGDSIR